MTDDLELIANKLNTDESELLVEIGNALEEGVLHAAPRPRSALIASATRWLKATRESIATAVCGSATVKRHVKNSNDVLLVSAVADLLAKASIGVAPVTVATLLVKRGIEGLCDDRW